jgi:hypothetical protein
MRFAQFAGVVALVACGKHAAGGPALSLAPQAVEMPPGAVQQFTASDGAAAWSVAEAGGGSVASDGRYTAPAEAGTYHVVATAKGAKATAVVTVTAQPPVAVAIDPPAADVAPGATLQLHATVTGAPDRGVLWSVREGGSVDDSGMFQAPQQSGLYHVVATSRADPSCTASAAISVSVRPVITVSIDPPAAALQPGGALKFNAAVTGTANTAVHWFVAEGSAGGTIDANGAYLAPPGEGTFHVVAASDADPGKSASAEVKVAHGIEVTLSPPAATVAQGASQRFTATASGGDPNVTWSVAEGPAGGWVDAGLYHAPRMPGTYHLVAASEADPSRKATAVITVPAQTVKISMAPVAVTITAGAQMRFTASVTGSQETRVYWSSDGGAIAQDGTYTAPAAEGTYRVTAQAFADPTRSADAKVTVVAPGSVAVQVDPLQATVHVGDSVQFRAQVSGSSDGQVTWSIVEGSRGGSIDANGLYQSPDREGVFHIMASANANPSASTTSTVTVSWFDLTDHGGPVAAATRTFALWWGNASALPADARPTVESLLGSLGGSSHLAILDQYLRGAHATTAFGGSLFDTSTPPSTDDPAAVEREACNALLASGRTPAAGDAVLVYGSSSLTTPSYCAWHWYATCGPVTLLVAWIPNPAGTGCVAASRGCNSVTDVTNAIAAASVHELFEAITDPYAGTWLDSSSEEIADKCMGDLGCVGLGSSTFQLQSEYSNALHACTF